MNILNKIFSNKHEEFANHLAEYFIEKCPLEVINNQDNKKNKSKYSTALNKLFSETRDYNRKNKLNMYTKAKIGNRFMWKLKDAGYEEVVAEKLATDLLKILG